jgi:ribonucleoside-diphosphate reductase alpha chain
MVSKIKKRTGMIVDFNSEKISQVIWKAVQSVGGKDQERVKFLTEDVINLLDEKYKEYVPSVEQVQDTVEKVLIEQGHAKTAKSFILYRQKRKEIRGAKKLMGIEDDTKFSLNALKVLEGRYLQKDKDGQLLETPKQLFQRVACNIAQADWKYSQDAQKSEREFLKMMLDRDFMPNSPTLMNAGTKMQQLSGCFVLPVEDSIGEIFESVKNAAIIHQSGGGTGFAFSRLRPKGDPVGTAGGVASGPISFMKVFNAATEQIKQGGKRRGANMGVLRVDHPDILDFITCKERDDTINNFNISVGITDKFMEAVKEDKNYDLINPKNNEIYNKLNAKRVFDLICTMAWKNGDPGIIFLDTINKKHVLPEKVESTNPCGEVPLLPYESCNLGSINLSNHTKDNQVDWEKLKYTVHTAVHFLDNVIDAGKFPLHRITEMVLANRKIGLGVMGFADMLIKLKIPYDSEEALQLGEKTMRFVDTEAKAASVELAKIRGTFPNFEQSIFNDGKPENKVRNATLTSIAPTGTISIIASCSSGIEPLFAISYLRKTPQFELLEINPLFEDVARQEEFYTEELMKVIAKKGSIQNVEEIPEQIRKFFVTAMDLAPENHVKMQAAFQKHTDNAVSKTVNFPFSATVEEVSQTYLLAHKLGCKGTTIYRDGSRDLQVLNVTREREKHQPADTSPKEEEENQMVTVDAEYAGGCATCDV